MSTQFTYLGSLITSDGRCTKEIRKRIVLAKDSFNKMSTVFKNRQLKLRTKIRLLECFVCLALRV